MSKIYCVLDASSYIYLNKFPFIINGSEITLYKLLKRTNFVAIRHSPTILSEIRRNFAITAAEALALNNTNHTFTKYQLEHFDQTLFNNTMSTSTADRGEKENVCVSIDLFTDGKHSIVYLTDDKKAGGEKGHLQQIIGAFPYFKIWSSFDVVLFLYFTFYRNFLDYSKAIDSLKDLMSITYGTRFKQLEENRRNGITIGEKYAKKRDELTAEAQGKQIEYTQKLDIIRNLIST